MMRGAGGRSLFPTAERAGLAMLGGNDISIDLDGLRVRGHYWPIAGNDAGDDAAGLVVVCPGFTEFCEKHSGTCYAFHERGYDVLVIDWPGQGCSGHLGVHPLAVHIDNFDIYLQAMERMIDAAGQRGRDIILFGHSMGGHLALRIADDMRKKELGQSQSEASVKGVILSAPMMLPPVAPAIGVRLVASLLNQLGWSKLFPPYHEIKSLTQSRRFEENNTLTSWQPGYEAQFLWLDNAPEMRRNGPTVGWISAAYASCANHTMSRSWMRQLEVPVLALLAGDERVVDKAASARMLPLLPKGEIHEIGLARHEVLQETPEIVAEAWAHIDQFLGRI